MLETQACQPFFKKTLSLSLALLLFCGVTFGLTFDLRAAHIVHAEDADEPIVLPDDESEEPLDQDDNQVVEDPDSAGSPEAPVQGIITVVKIDWSGIDAAEIPAEVDVIIVPNNNVLYATSLIMTAANNWQSNYEMPPGTSEVNFNLPATGFQFSVESQGNTYVLIPTKDSVAMDPYVNTVNTNPGAELQNVAIPSANNDVPANAELKIRLDKGDAAKESINFAKEIKPEVSPEDKALEEKLAENAEGTVNNKLYIIAAIIAAVLAITLILIRVVISIKNRKAAREEAAYYSQQEKRRRR
ncbi:MAG: hypothetical protein Q4P08_02425 [Eubacteriales bacterium]|nr:hypothetical protein [Eubacteriales bacterium]